MPTELEPIKPIDIWPDADPDARWTLIREVGVEVPRIFVVTDAEPPGALRELGLVLVAAEHF